MIMITDGDDSAYGMFIMLDMMVDISFDDDRRQ